MFDFNCTAKTPDPRKHKAAYILSNVSQRREESKDLKRKNVEETFKVFSILIYVICDNKF